MRLGVAPPHVEYSWNLWCLSVRLTLARFWGRVLCVFWGGGSCHYLSVWGVDSSISCGSTVSAGRLQVEPCGRGSSNVADTATRLRLLWDVPSPAALDRRVSAAAGSDIPMLPLAMPPTSTTLPLLLPAVTACKNMLGPLAH